MTPYDIQRDSTNQTRPVVFFEELKDAIRMTSRYVDQSSTPFSSFMTNRKSTGMASYDTQGLPTHQNFLYLVLDQ